MVTASSGGIGYAIVAGLAESHAEVIVNGRSNSSVDAALSRLQQQFPQARLRDAVADLGCAEGVTALRVDGGGGVDIL